MSFAELRDELVPQHDDARLSYLYSPAQFALSSVMQTAHPGYAWRPYVHSVKQLTDGQTSEVAGPAY